MHILGVVSLLGLLSFSAASPALLHERGQPSIAWGACNKTEFTPDIVSQVPTSLQCGTLDVPLDYTKPRTSPKLTLSLVKIAAANKPQDAKAKSILFNFGGPGLEARFQLVSASGLLMSMTGGGYNLVAFDPRGSANTIPFSCSEDPLDFYMLTKDVWGVPNDYSRESLGRFWATAQAAAEKCAEYGRETGLADKISTPFVARDMMSVAVALREDGLIRYWGYSYGSTLGATILSMFPDKVDKVVLDGVLNSHQYYNHLVDSQQWSLSDAVVKAIFPSCVKNPNACPLAKRSPKATAGDLEEQFKQLLSKLQTHPLAWGPKLVDYSTVKQALLNVSYSYHDEGLEDFLQQLVVYLDLADNKPVPAPPADDTPAQTTMENQMSQETLLGIHCLDRNARLPANSSLDSIMPAIEELNKTSKYLADADVWSTMICANWKINPPEKFNSDFRVAPRNPVLFLSNSVDGDTPSISAYNLSSTVQDSTVLVTKGYGHTSLSNPSLCTLQHTAGYWANGTMPKNGSTCPFDAPIFSNVTWSTILEKVFQGQGGVKLYQNRKHYDGR